MNWKDVESSNVARVGYDEQTYTLGVEFHGGEVYHYYEVPKSLFDKLCKAKSVGGFLNKEIKGQYRYAKQ